MRKLICLLLALTIACGLCAFAEPADTVPDPALTEAQLTEMLPVINALARTLDTGDEAVYNPNDAAFVWTQLRALAAGTKSSAAATTVGPAVTLSAEDLTVYAAASFAGMTELPPLPAFPGQVRVKRSPRLQLGWGGQAGAVRRLLFAGAQAQS